MLIGVAVVIGILVPAPAASAAAGDLDPSFDDDGKVFTSENQIEDVALQADGKIIAFGDYFNWGVRNWDSFLARYNPDGSLDSTFGSGGKVETRQPARGIGSVGADHGPHLGTHPDPSLGTVPKNLETERRESVSFENDRGATSS